MKPQVSTKPKSRFRNTGIGAVVGILLAGAASTSARAATATAGPDFFEQRIRPLLHSECVECHGPEKQKGGLRVDFRDGLRRGGKGGPAVVPGKSAESLLVRSVRHDAGVEPMPKDRPRVPDAAIADLAAWIDAGAEDPRDQPPAAGTAAGASNWESTFATRRDWWSFRPIADPPVPQVGDAAWPSGAVDRFLLAAMEARGLRPSGDADRRTLLRRATFLLTGLPPTPQEVEAFVGDTEPGAWAKVVDRLLGSPQFGETWARHWMDLMRFAETHGSEGDPDIPDAWRYRDYLVRAFNADVPLDRLIREHVAGDLLETPRRNAAEGVDESIIGLAHFRLVEHGFNPVDTLDEQMKTLDSQIDVVSKAFQGLTTSCARCHSHKFDPISDRDYAALQGVFASVRSTRLTIDLPERLTVHRDRLESLRTLLRGNLGEAWDRAVDPLIDRLMAPVDAGAAARTALPGSGIQAEIRRLETEVARLESLGRAAALQRGGESVRKEAVVAGPKPIAAWSFDTDARDAVGNLHGSLEGGAKVLDGRLVLDGRSAFLQTPPLATALGEKTLEAWVFLADLTQRGGGVVTVETSGGGEFDALVFGEQEARHWLAGSDGFARTRSAGGPAETAAPGERIHAAVVYRQDGTVVLYRNGEPYGEPRKPGSPKRFAAGGARVLLGRRHTGGSNAFLSGAIDEARLFDRALTAEEIRAGYLSGPGQVSRERIVAALTPAQAAELASVEAELANRRLELERRFPDFPTRLAERNRWQAALDRVVAQEGHPLSDLRRFADLEGDGFASAWKAHVKRREGIRGERLARRNGPLKPAWDFSGGGFQGWFRYGANPPESIPVGGGFAVEPVGERILAGLLPAGVHSHRLSQKHNGVFASPRFRVETDRISVRVVGGKGARVRLIPDLYPIGQGNIFPQSNIDSDAPTWIRLDTAYRKGSTAYLEFATADDVTSRDRSPAGPGGRSFFGVMEVVFHDAGAAPESADPGEPWWDSAAPPASLAEWGGRLRSRLKSAVAAWRSRNPSEDQRLFLDSFVRAGLLPSTTNDLPEVLPTLAEYRRLESEIPVPRRVPGVVEADAADSPLYSRGDPRKPQATVPRGYLRLVSTRPYRTERSGRLELAEDLTAPSNPLTARVMANRIWYHVFGRGLVGTLDNFGRLGETPTHPELLDWLARRLVAERWSTKAMLRELMLSRAFRLSSEPPSDSAQKDPANTLLTHARVRRLEAEMLRDALLALGRRLDLTQFGAGSDALAPVDRQTRRSLYLTVRRNFLSPFLETFDQPRPFTTLGQREVTNVPAQSLALLNDPFVVAQAARWAEVVTRGESTAAGRIRRFHAEAFARPPSDAELAAAEAYVADLRRLHGSGADADAAAWRDYAQALFNLKEFLFLR